MKDQSKPEKTADARVKVKIERDQRNPQFDPNNYQAAVAETIAVNAKLELKPKAIQVKDDDLKVYVKKYVFGMWWKYFYKFDID